MIGDAPRPFTRRRALSRLANTADELHPLLRRIYQNRNVQHIGELDYSLKMLHPPELLKGIDAAAMRLKHAIELRQKILVIGDYDTDGATATAVALLGLRALGANSVQYLAPNRFTNGYGLSSAIAEVALTKKPDLVITVDNGIASIAGVAKLREAGVSVVVTDHHLPGDELPNADAIVNPNQKGCAFPSKSLAGVGVMFYLLLALRTALRDGGHFDEAREPNLAELLDLVALGTVADMVALDYNNRILVAQGIARICARRCRPGIAALLQIAGGKKDRAKLDASDLGFIIAPRLNAAGRMDDISAGIECLLADDDIAAMALAKRLDDINRDRRQVEKTMQAQAAKIVARLEKCHDKRGKRGEQGGQGQGGDDTHGMKNNGATAAKRGWCLFDPDWHQGIVGLVANRIREQSNQPAIVFAPGDDGKLRGSARSVGGLHIRDLLESISIHCPDLIEKFGGHAMAAGLTIAADNFAAFAAQFGDRVAAHFQTHAPDIDIVTDGALHFDDFTLEVAELMRDASPWGQQFPAPLFDGEFRVIQQRVVGEQHLKMIVTPLGDETENADGCKNGNDDDGGGGEFDAILFRCVEPGDDAPMLDRVKIAYQLQVNEFKGKRTVQLLVEHLQPCLPSGAGA